MTTLATRSAEQGICDDCGTPGPVMNANTVGNPWWLCGRCMHSTHDDVYVNAHIKPYYGGDLSITSLAYTDGPVRITVDRWAAYLTVEQAQEAIAALQVALARQEAAKGAKGDG